jgi:hypothetical protein
MGRCPLCGIGKGALPPYVFFRRGVGIGKARRRMYFWVGVGIGKASRRMYFWAEVYPPKNGDLSCAQSCRPVSLRETGGGISLSLVEVGVSGGIIVVGKATCW